MLTIAMIKAISHRFILYFAEMESMNMKKTEWIRYNSKLIFPKKRKMLRILSFFMYFSNRTDRNNVKPGAISINGYQSSPFHR
jgi:hypothetical protein